MIARVAATCPGPAECSGNALPFVAIIAQGYVQRLPVLQIPCAVMGALAVAAADLEPRESSQAHHTGGWTVAAEPA